MILKSIKYSQFAGDPDEWQLDKCIFTNINLIVGKNATGKTKILNIIKALSNLLSRDRKLNYLSGNYTVLFDKRGKEIKYILEYMDKKVIREQLSIDSEILLKRGKTGKGYIKAKEANILKMPFMTPKDEIAAFSKRDSIQHPFLDDLYNWGDNLTHFYFGTQLGKDVLVAVIKDKEKKAGLDLKNTDMVVAKFIEGEEKFGKQFVDTIKSNMEEIGYKTDNIEVGPLKSILFMGEGASKPMGINVKEADLSGITDQHSMSQGMFRALSLVIQITFSLMADIPSCILIDDIGEGLDYERSSNLLRVLIKKAMHKNVQLIMTTNDRFVMNNVPLEYWSVIRRIGNRSAIYNYQNSKKMFTSFELTGLSNFDFFSSNYLLQE